MKWIIGIDEKGHSRGALRFAKWMREATVPDGADEFVAVHVLEADHLRVALLRQHFPELVAEVRQVVSRQIEAESCGVAVRELEVREGLTADEGLEEACERYGARGIIVGRSAASHGHHLIRLGTVARRLLRRLPCTLIVVPPDLRAADLGPGPVAAVSRPTVDSVEAYRVAGEIASHAARKLAVAHVGPSVAPAPHGASRLSDWLARHAIRPGITAELKGEAVHSALAFAEAQRAPLVVASASVARGVERLFTARFGRKLAAEAHIPVAIVPTLA